MVAVASLPKEIAAGLHPKQSNAIRGLLLQSGWVVEKLEDDSCVVTYVVQVTNNLRITTLFWFLVNINSHCFFLFVLVCFQLDPAGWLPKCFVNRFNTKLVMIIENLKKLAQACPSEGEIWLLCKVGNKASVTKYSINAHHFIDKLK